MRIATWNIQHGGGSRAKHIVAAVIAHDPDVIVFTEVRESTRPIREDLAEAGYKHQIDQAVAKQDNGVCVVSRFSLKAQSAAAAPDRWLEVGIADAGLTLVGVHLRIERRTRHEEWQTAA